MWLALWPPSAVKRYGGNVTIAASCDGLRYGLVWGRHGHALGRRNIFKRLVTASRMAVRDAAWRVSGGRAWRQARHYGAPWCLAWLMLRRGFIAKHGGGARQRT